MKHMNHRLFALLLLLLTLGTLTSAFAQITPSQDSYTDTSKATTNFGTATTLGVASSTASLQNTYIQFDLSSVPAGYTSANVAKATLKLYVNSVATAGTFNVDFVNGSWSEKTMTADLVPALGTTIASNVGVSSANVHDYILVDVTAAVGDWLNGSQANDGIALVANSGLSATFDSKENTTQSQPAELVIVFTAGGTISGVTTASGSGLIGGGTTGTLNLGLQTCATKQVLQWNGSAWVCAAVGTGTISGVTAGSGLTGGGTSGAVTLAIANKGVTTAQIGSGAATNGQVLTANGTGGASWQAAAGASTWAMTGNAGTNCTTSPCADFLGTTDASNLEFRVNNNRAFRIEAATDTQAGFGFSPNVIGGFSGNAVTAGAAGATIAGGGGGIKNGTSYINSVGGSFGVVGGGLKNVAAGEASTVAGGILNTASSGADTVAGGETNTASGGGSTVAGGNTNIASGQFSTVGGGTNNTAGVQSSTVAGGSNNIANNPYATVAGGYGNKSQGYGSTVAGGLNNTLSGTGSFAAGQYTTDINGLIHNGVFLWGDSSTTTPLAATADNQFLIRSVGGVGIGTNSPVAQLHVASTSGNPQAELDQGLANDYARLRLDLVGSNYWDIAAGGPTDQLNFFQAGYGNVISIDTSNSNTLMAMGNGASLSAGGTWTNASDRNLKEDFLSVDGSDLLKRLQTVPMLNWKYKNETGVRHIGPMAQDFYIAFKLGSDDKHIATVDEGGVALAAIQELYRETLKKDTEIQDLRKQVAGLSRRVSELSKIQLSVTALEARLARMDAQTSARTHKLHSTTMNEMGNGTNGKSLRQ